MVAQNRLNLVGRPTQDRRELSGQDIHPTGVDLPGIDRELSPIGIHRQNLPRSIGDHPTGWVDHHHLVKTPTRLAIEDIVIE